MLILDTGALVAAAVSDDPDHLAFVALLRSHPGQLVTCEAVIAEAAFLVERIAGSAAAGELVAGLAASGVAIEPLQRGDLDRVAELLTTYADLRLGFCDASVIALAERLGVSDIATVDHRDFTVVRPRHLAHFTLLP